MQRMIDGEKGSVEKTLAASYLKFDSGSVGGGKKVVVAAAAEVVIMV